MKSKMIMTSMVCLAFAMPAFAAPSNSSNTFPSNGQMQEDTKYVGAATQANLKTYEGSVTASANYTDTPYTVTAGNYLPMSSETVAQCTSGNYCPGINGTVNYSTSSNQGLSACPNGYPNSLAGATSDTECYTACTVANAGIANASAVSGNDYYGTGVDTCSATACDSGYHILAGFNPSTDLPATGTGAPTGTDYIARGPDGTYCNYDRDCMPDEDWDATVLANIKSQGLTQGEFRMTYGNGSVTGELRGIGQCSTQSGTGMWNGASTPGDVTTRSTLPDSTGRYCWCKPTGWQSTGGTMQTLSAPWVFSNVDGDAGDCAYNCANNCAYDLYADDPDYLAFRAAVFGSLGASGATCEANVISITWDGADAADVAANDAGQCTYGGDINTPKKAVHVPGKTFVGWTFDTPSGN